MKTRARGITWARGLDILSSVRDAVTNVIRVSLGDSTSPYAESDDAELWQHVGFASRPSKPERGKPGAQGLVMRGHVDACIATRDVRCASIYGQLDYGETCIFAAGEDGTGQARIILKKNGSVNLYTKKGNAADGAGQGIGLDADGGGNYWVDSFGNGIVTGSDGVTLTAGEASIKLGRDGTIRIIGKGQVQVDGATVVIGSAAVPVANAALTGPAGIIAKPSLKVLIE